MDPGRKIVRMTQEVFFTLSRISTHMKFGTSDILIWQKRKMALYVWNETRKKHVICWSQSLFFRSRRIMCLWHRNIVNAAGSLIWGQKIPCLFQEYWCLIKIRRLRFTLEWILQLRLNFTAFPYCEEKKTSNLCSYIKARTCVYVLQIGQYCDIIEKNTISTYDPDSKYSFALATNKILIFKLSTKCNKMFWVALRLRIMEKVPPNF